ncbi:hypothetical protein BG015_011404 [Linnemannia schmuckeri]|uniref:F-box domain-containing protein n=1 Tax=Linnemannia schmuckeri TaxID=64567 RepID=A0A9P5S726_9FUNG|nr:hypothetical protein BG015_011404 [Linnemannia schmuckeri]
MALSQHHHLPHSTTRKVHPSPTTTTTTATDDTSSVSCLYPSPTTTTATAQQRSTLQRDPAANKTPIQLNLPTLATATATAAPPRQRQESDPSLSALSNTDYHLPAETTADEQAKPESNSLSDTTRSSRHSQQLQSSPSSSALMIPELVQEVCSYLDRQTLVRASRISKQFLACCGPLLWADVPEHAWSNDYFCSHWQFYASQIRTVCCAAVGVDLPTLSLYCHNLVSLDVSKILGGERIRVNNHDKQQTDQQKRLYVQEQARVGCPSLSRNRLSSCNALINKQTSSRDPPFHNLSSNANNNSNSTVSQPEFDRAAHSAFLLLAEGLVKVLQANKNLERLQFKPHGRVPASLLKAMAQLDRLRLLSLNGWEDFQEYSLQLILESCPRLSHLSLGENDFTRFTLESFCSDYSTAVAPGGFGASTMEEVVVKLERYDDPIKGGNRSSVRYVDQGLLDIHSKRPVLFRPLSPSSLSAPGPALEDLRPHIDRPMLSYQNKSHQTSNTTPLCRGLQSLSLHQSGFRQDFLEKLTRQCPGLEHLSLLDGWGFYPSSRFTTILSESCPKLRRLEFRQQALDLQDEFFVSLCAQFPDLQWIHAGKTGFSQGGLEAVRLSCHSIVSLNLDGARGIQSPSLDLLLRTCGSLRSLRAEGVVLNGRDLVKDSRWASRGLETLVIEIEIWSAPAGGESESVEVVRERVYDYLSDLTRLQVLGLGGGHRVGGSAPGVDLTLGSGLAKLVSLHCLEELHIRSLFRAIQVDDVAWMVENWPRLWRLEVGKGPAFAKSRGGDNTNKAVEWLAQTRPGIDIRIS